METSGKTIMVKSVRRVVACGFIGVAVLFGTALLFNTDVGSGKSTLRQHEFDKQNPISNVATETRRLAATPAKKKVEEKAIAKKEAEEDEKKAGEDEKEAEEDEKKTGEDETEAEEDEKKNREAAEQEKAEAAKKKAEEKAAAKKQAEEEEQAKRKAAADLKKAKENCPACAPKTKMVPDVVIPFFERDLCKLKYTVKSIVKNDPDHNLGDVFLMWVSTKPHTDYEEDLKEVVSEVSGDSRKVTLIDFSPQVLDSHFSGWFAQQVLKLKIASLVTSDYYLVMDSKNTIIRTVTPDIFFTPCNQAKLFTQFHFNGIPKPHSEWYAASARELGITNPGSLQTYWPASITPMVFHTETVLDMLAKIGEDPQVDTICSGPLCTIFGVYLTKPQDQDHGTEFTMFIMYAYAKKAALKCIYAIEQKDEDDPDQMALSLWRGVKGNRKTTMKNDLETVQNITKGILKPLMFGSQPSALDDMTPEHKEKTIKHLVKLYENANLFNHTEEDVDKFVDCVIGKY